MADRTAPTEEQPAEQDRRDADRPAIAAGATMIGFLGGAEPTAEAQRIFDEDAAEVGSS
ncbi:MAG TPA: hypothetical protein VFE14_17315 [Micromonosporaceae bacterium]|jgi:hypothetical protein|nr:hypothetical protein [Micromonosporaceae bacterium]